MSTPSPSESLAAYRADFPVLRRELDGRPVVYLDSAATSLKPQPVIDAITDYYSRIGANVHRGKHYLSEEASDRFEEARVRVAQLVGAVANEVIFTRNTTEALNLVARGLGLERGDLVVGSLDAHHSQLLPWQRAATLELVRLDGRGALDLNHFEELLKKRPRVVAITHCSNVTGVYAPAAAMVKMAREAGAITVLDAAQSVPHRRVDVGELGVDFLAFSGHKALGPTGLGVLYGRHEQLEKLQPLLLGGGTVDWVEARSHRLRKIPHRFEAGTPHIAGVIGMGAAVGYLNRVGYEALHAHDSALAAAFLEGARTRPWLRVIGPGPEVERCALLCLAIEGRDDLSDVARMLSDSYGIMCRTGHHCAQPLVDLLSQGEVLRASAYLYNGAADVEAFFQALDRIQARLKKKA